MGVNSAVENIVLVMVLTEMRSTIEYNVCMRYTEILVEWFLVRELGERFW